MALRIRRIGLDDTPSAQLSLEALARVDRPTIVSEVIDRCAAREKRAPKLPASAVLLLCVAMNLYSSECLTHVFFRLAGRMRWLLADPNALRVSKGALCQARYRLGARPLVELFRRVCKPLATPATPGAFLFGLRLMALDGTLIDAPDTPGNVRAFGKRRAPRGQSAWPQIRLVAMSECATHAVVEAGVWPHDFDERAAGRRLLPRGAQAGMLLLWDRGFHSFEMVRAVLASGAHLLGRLPR
jgi:Insertion element 4 transposase N-terminal